LLKKPCRKEARLSAAHAIVDLPAQPELRAVMELTELTATMERQAAADHQPHLPHNCSPLPKSNARAKPLPETLDPEARKDPMDQPAMLDLQALMAVQDLGDHPAQAVQPAQLATQEALEPPEMQAVSLEPVQARPVNQERTVIQAVLAQLVVPEHQARTAAPAQPVHQVMLALQAVPAMAATLAALVTPVSLVHLAAANTAHQLVRLQDTKLRSNGRDRILAVIKLFICCIVASSCHFTLPC